MLDAQSLDVVLGVTRLGKMEIRWFFFFLISDVTNVLAKSSGKLPFTASDVVGGSCVVVLLLLMGSEVGTLMCSAVSVDCEVFVAFCAAPGINNPSGFTIDRILDDVGVTCLVRSDGGG